VIQVCGGKFVREVASPAPRIARRVAAPGVRPAPTRQAIASDQPSAQGPEGVLAAFRDAFVNRDPDAYAALLADDYVFRFRPEDVSPGEPDTLDRAGEVAFARHILRGGAASGASPAERVEFELSILVRSGDAEGIWQAFLVMT